MTANMDTRLTRMTRRESELVAHLVRGKTTGAIASEMGLTISTVATYMKRAYAKHGVHSRAELTAKVLGL